MAKLADAHVPHADSGRLTSTRLARAGMLEHSLEFIRTVLRA